MPRHLVTTAVQLGLVQTVRIGVERQRRSPCTARATGRLQDSTRAPCILLRFAGRRARLFVLSLSKCEPCVGMEFHNKLEHPCFVPYIYILLPIRAGSTSVHSSARLFFSPQFKHLCGLRCTCEALFSMMLRSNWKSV